MKRMLNKINNRANTTTEYSFTYSVVANRLRTYTMMNGLL